MDIYTASKRISRSVPLGDEPLEIDSYGAIGDGHTCALVGANGSIDWLCMPRFDSPSVFAALLDREAGGCFRVGPAQSGFESLQAYDDATNVLQTLFRRDGDGVAVLTDLMPWNGDPRSSLHELLRLIEGREGTLEMEVVFDPRFDFGRGETRVSIVDEGVMAEGPRGERLTLSIGSGIRFEPRPQGGVRARFRLRNGKRVWLVASWGGAAARAGRRLQALRAAPRDPPLLALLVLTAPLRRPLAP